MNMDYDEECGAAPGVMGHRACTNRNCSCCEREPEYERREPEYAQESYESYARPVASSAPFAMGYAFIQHQTDKAVLFGVQDGNGLRNQWVPKSVILGIDNDNKRVMIASWFKSRITA